MCGCVCLCVFVRACVYRCSCTSRRVYQCIPSTCVSMYTSVSTYGLLQVRTMHVAFTDARVRTMHVCIVYERVHSRLHCVRTSVCVCVYMLVCFHGCIQNVLIRASMHARTSTHTHAYTHTHTHTLTTWEHCDMDANKTDERPPS